MCIRDRIWATNASGYSAMGATKPCSSSAVSGVPWPEYPDEGTDAGAAPWLWYIIAASAPDPIVATIRTKHRATDNVCLFNVLSVIDFLLGDASGPTLQ